MMKTKAAAMMLFIILFLLGACVTVTAPPTSDTVDEAGTTLQPQESSPMLQKPQILNVTVSQAVHDLATRLGVPTEAVTVLEAATVVWADSSLGCPEPGAMYAQVLQEGMRIRLQVGEQVYSYHSSATRKPFLCQNPAEPSAAPAPSPTATGNLGRPPAVQAAEDLAARLQIGVDQIKVVRSVEVNWPDTSLGCPQPGMRYTQVMMNGTFIQLEAGGQLYNYHGASARLPFLCISKDEVLPEDLPQY